MPTSKSLHIALKKAVDDLGMDILKSPMLVNVLTDYHAFDVHNNNSKTIKSRLFEMISSGQIEEVLSWKELSKKRIERNKMNLLKQYDNDKDVKCIIDSVLNSLGLSDYPTFCTKDHHSLVMFSVSAAPVTNKPLQSNKPRKDARLCLKNIGCVLFGILFFVPFGIYAFSQDEIGWGLLCLFSALLCVIGPFVNPDFWK
jgi:hypothetical protein